MANVKRIKEDSVELCRLKERINETFLRRSDSAAHQAQWKQACAEFHARLDDLSFPGGRNLFERVRAGDPLAVEAAVEFLVADPMHFRSGYLKEDLWRWIVHCDLSISARNRLESAAMRYLTRQISREFWCMCKAIARLGRPHFWVQVSAVSHQLNTPQGFRAFCLLTYGASIDAGSALRSAVYRTWLGRKYSDA